MNISIRKYLLFNLLLAFVITTTLTAISTYYLEKEDIQRHIDILSSMSTLTYQALLDKKLNPQELEAMQTSLNQIPDKLKALYQDTDSDLHSKPLLDAYNFQLWNHSGELLLKQENLPALPPIQSTSGFSVEKIDQEEWRVFRAYNPKTGLITTLGERHDTHSILNQRIALDDFYIILLTVPITALIIWWVISKGLSSMNRLTREVSNRKVGHLEPVDTKRVPSEIKPMIHAMNDLFLRLQQTFDREKRFASDAAHELRTPLAVIKTQVQVAAGCPDTKERNDYLDGVVLGVDRCTHVVEQLLTMSRISPESPSMIDSGKVNLPQLSSETLAQLAPSAIDKRIDIGLNAKDTTIMVDGNITAIGVLLHNLVENAIRYTPRGGFIKINVYLKGEHPVFRIEDTGPGIPLEMRTRVFERFFRVLGNETPGSGLGLAIVKRIAKLHNAKVELSDSEEGTGLVVEVIFQPCLMRPKKPKSNKNS